ncbi:MAG TPA: 4'-phosphopantetheinyl transferase superfamily protein [Opitutaceae bacterium]|nr:4'-phosphopantetheinyl transferase superfamily protein [Opitutaceae bacterium]
MSRGERLRRTPPGKRRHAAAVMARRRTGGPEDLWCRRRVDVWRAALDGVPDRLLAESEVLLSADERHRAAEFFFERDRRRFIVGRGILRLLLARYLDRPAADIRFRYGPNGKPALAETPPRPLHFNLAHSDAIAVYAFTGVGEVGVDVERVRELPDWEQIAATYFSRAENARLRAAPPDRRQQAFFEAWTRQEAWLKAVGVGLGGSPGGPTDTVGEPGFSIHPLAIDEGYAGAVAVNSAAREIAAFDWDNITAGTPDGAGLRVRQLRLEQGMELGGQFL